MNGIRAGVLAFGLAVAAVGPLFAQSMASDLGRFPVGTTITWQNSDKLYFTHIVRGKDAKGYRLDFFAGRKATGPLEGTYWVDGKGQFLHFIWADGREVRYSPHACNRTPGTCRFTETRKGQPPQTLLHVATPSADGFTYIETDATSGAVWQTGSVTLGANGLNVRGWFQYPGEKRLSLRLVKVMPPD